MQEDKGLWEGSVDLKILVFCIKQTNMQTTNKDAKMCMFLKEKRKL